MATDNGPIEDLDLGKEGIVDLLSSDDKEELLKEDDVEEKEEEDKEEKEEDEDEIKLEEDEDEKLSSKTDDPDLIIPVRKKEILKAYPDLFKKFPYLEAAYHRDGQFTEIVATPEEAKQAVENSKTLAKFSNELFSGNTTNIIKVVKDNDPEGFKTLVDNYLPSLRAVDKEAFDTVITNVIKTTIYGMVEAAQEGQDEELLAHAKAITQYLFNTTKLSPPVKLGKDIKKDDSFEKERAEFENQKFTSASTELQERVDNRITSTINVNIDPKNVMSPFVKKHATKEAFNKVEELISQDSRFASHLTNLWKQAHSNGFNRNSLDKIQSAYLSKAKSLLPDAIKLARASALKNSGKSNGSDDKDRRGPLPVSRSSHTESPKREKGSIPSGMSNKDFIMSD